LKLYALILVSLVAGAAFGVGLTWAEYGHSPAELIPQANRLSAAPSAGVPRLVVPVDLHDFGSVEPQIKLKHAFVIRNEGDGVLTLKAGPTTCSACTIAELTHDKVPPGGSTEVVVEYEAGVRATFRQTATVLSNDPRKSRIELTVTGTISARYSINPPVLDFGNVPAGESATVETRIEQFMPGEFTVEPPQIESGGSSELFELRVEPLAEADLSPEAVNGYQLLATVKPGLPLGPFRRTIRLTIGLDKEGKKAEQQIPLLGKVVSDLSIVGSGWRSDVGVLTLGSVPSKSGLSRELMLLLRGEHRDRIEVEPKELDPPWLKVSLGERSKLNESVDQMPLVVEIPPGQAPSIHLGTDQGAMGTIVLGVKNYPGLGEIRMRVKFVVE